MKDLYNNLSNGVTVAPGAIVTASVTGTGVDLYGYEAAVVNVHVGVLTDGTFTPQVQECATSGGTYTNVVSTDLLGAFTALASTVSQKVGYIGSQRFIRLFVTVSGTTTGGYLNSTINRGYARSEPAGATQHP